MEVENMSMLSSRNSLPSMAFITRLQWLTHHNKTVLLNGSTEQFSKKFGLSFMLPESLKIFGVSSFPQLHTSKIELQQESILAIKLHTNFIMAKNHPSSISGLFGLTP